MNATGVVRNISRHKPLFFDEIAARSAKRWEQLESDPGLAAPWLSLFQQVDSPRHVLSELLQNAEDAGATWARCAVINQEFIFEHNGSDFEADTLSSLCEFAYSNKRTLHTIGFRGIGFKTTFSLGPVVIVETPSLAFHFDKQRFTLPVWMDDAEPLAHTRIRVQVEDNRRCAAVSENLAEWLQSPVPLLFFNSLQSLEISNVRVEKEVTGPGPVSGSEWVQLQSEHLIRVLKISADAEEMPADALEEIRQARSDNDFKPATCSLDLIFGLSENRVYTVLPTQVMPQLPFSCNAPFLQEPSRVRILDPAYSPTNRWLLEQVAWIAARSLFEWVSDENVSIEDRARGYNILPLKTVSPLTALDGAVRGIIIEELEEWLTPSNCLIGQSGSLYSASACANVPRDFVEAWGAETAIALLCGGKETCIHFSVPENTRENLAAWGLLEARDDTALKEVLEAAQTLPRPATEEGLIQLWSAVEELLGETAYRWRREPCVYPVVPAVGSDQLHRPKDICRTVAQPETLNREDHTFLCQMVKIADGSFLELLEGGTSEEDVLEDVGPAARERLERAKVLLDRCTLENWSLPRVFEAACAVTFRTTSTREARFRLTRIAVKADLSASDAGLAFLCQDGTWRSAKHGLIYSNGFYDDLLPERWLGECCISKEYEELMLEEAGAAKRWLGSPKSGLHDFPIPQRKTSKLWSHHAVTSEATQRGGTTPDFWRASSRYEFDLTDFDWGTELVSHWEKTAEEEPDVWAHLVEACARSWGQHVPAYSTAKIDRPKGAARYTVSEGLVAAWLHRLQSLPCLRDDRWNQPELPHNLLYRTPETEPLLNIEKFVHHSLDNAQTRPLLERLGVRSQPQSADKLMQRLRALAETSQPPLTRVLDLYRALDGLHIHLDTEGRLTLQATFEHEALVLDDDGGWQRRPHVYQANDEELPGIAVIHREMRSLGLWNRINVDRSPTIDKVMDWLRRLPSRTEIAPLERKRVTAVLGRTPRAALDACQHWLSRTGAWMPWQDLRFFVVSRAADAEGDGPLFLHMRRQVADFSMITATQVELLKGHLRPLRDVLTHEVDATESNPSPLPEWVKPLALGILRAQPEGDLEETLDPETAEFQDRLEAVDLYYSNLQKAQALRLVPFLEGEQVGTPASARALWEDQSIYVVGPEPSHYRDLVEQIGRRFSLKVFQVAVGDCVGRSASWIDDYFADRFSLRSLSEAEYDLGLASPSTVPAPPPFSPAPPPFSNDQDKFVAVGQNGSEDGNHLISNPEAPCADLQGSEEPAADDQSAEADTAYTHLYEQEQNPDEEQTLEKQSEASDTGVDLPEANVDRRRTPARQSLLQIYLANEGFCFDEQRRCYLRQSDGATVQRETGSAFHTLYDSEGQSQQEYWEHTASVTDGIIIPAEIWLFLVRRPDQCSLVALAQNGTPLVLSGTSLLRWRAEQYVTLTATAYRLKFSDEWIASSV